MQVILLKPVPTLGNPGDIVNAKPGYASNFLIPKKLATTDLKAKVNLGDTGLSDTKATAILKKLAKKKLRITKKVNAKGGLFSAVSQEEILKNLVERAKALGKINLKVKTKKPIKEVGVSEVELNLNGKKAKMQIEVVGKAETKAKPETKTNS